MVPVIGLTVFLGRFAVIAGAVLVAIFAFKEFARATGVYRDWWMTGGVYIALVASGIACYIPHPGSTSAGWYGLFSAMPIYAVAFLLIIPVIRNRTQGQLQLAALCIVGFFQGWMFLHLAFLANSRNPYGYILFAIFMTEVNDIAAFTLGKLLGRHPLRSEISPRKTWEGAIGALLFSLVLTVLLRFSFGGTFTLIQLLMAGLIVSIGGQLGDLCISVIKRDIGIKDLGAMIPGHGGLLDRIDSLILVAPLLFHMIRYLDGNR